MVDTLARAALLKRGKGSRCLHESPGDSRLFRIVAVDLKDEVFYVLQTYSFQKVEACFLRGFQVDAVVIVKEKL